MPVQIQSIVSNPAGIDKMKKLERVLGTSIARALNRTTEKTKTESARRILRQIRVKPSDLSGARAKLTLGNKAHKDRLRATLNAESRPRSLANFIVRVLPKGRGVVVSVKRSKVITIKRAFLTKLRGYGGSTEDRFANYGLAIRLRPGETVNSRRWEQNTTKDGRTLLYGPSVQQTFLDNQRNGVAKDVSKRYVQDTFEKEFDRNLKFLGTKG